MPLSSRLSAKAKLIIRFSLLFGVLLLCLQSILVYTHRALSLSSARRHAFGIADMLKDNLSSFMRLGIYNQRHVIIDRIREVEGVRKIRIVRGENVERVKGPGSEESKPQMDLEFLALQTGEVQERLTESRKGVEYVLVIPYKASSRGANNCVACHQVKEGDILGAVAMTFDLTGERERGLYSMLFTALTSLLFFGGTIFALYGFFRPYSRLFEQFRAAFRRIAEGDFHVRVVDTEPIDGGEMGHEYTHMVNRLSGTLSEVAGKAALLVGGRDHRTGNALRDTLATVEELVEIYKYKRIIEKDTSKLDIFDRMEDVLRRQHIGNYSLYEVNSARNTITVASARADGNLPGTTPTARGGNPELERQEPIWCNAEILGNGQECRAVRTGTAVDSREFPKVCSQFACVDRGAQGDIHHYCEPLYIGGKVGHVVQVVYGREAREQTDRSLPYLRSYFQETMPVLEGKIFMELMREQTLVDQLTGLYNRRFLEELSGKLNSYVSRNETSIGVMMVDIDYFKMVNDEQGHDVGDIVLKSVTAAIVRSVRQGDIVVRYGGEEILVLLMGVAEGKAQEVGEKVRRTVEKERIEFTGGTLSKTVSIGIGEFPTHTDRFWQCVKYADVALYKAKNDGRNRVVYFTPDIWPEGEY